MKNKTLAEKSYWTGVYTEWMMDTRPRYYLDDEYHQAFEMVLHKMIWEAEFWDIENSTVQTQMNGLNEVFEKFKASDEHKAIHKERTLERSLTRKFAAEDARLEEIKKELKKKKKKIVASV